MMIEYGAKPEEYEPAVARVHVGNIGNRALTEVTGLEFVVSPEGVIGLPRDTILALAERVMGDETAIVWIHHRDEEHTEFSGPLEIVPGRVVLDSDNFKVLVDGIDVNMTLKELELLKWFVAHAGQVLTRGQIMEGVWGYPPTSEVASRTIDVHVRRLRAKLENFDPDTKGLLFETIRGVGYRFNFQQVQADDV